MSSFRFSDLPEEIGAVVAIEAAKFYRTYKPSPRNQHGIEKLKELSMTSLIFRDAAQSEIFAKVYLDGGRGLRNLINCIKSNPRLGSFVKDMVLNNGHGFLNTSFMRRESTPAPAGGHINLDRESLKLMPALHRIYCSAESVSFEILAVAKGLVDLNISCTPIFNNTTFTPFSNLTHLELMDVIISNVASRATVANFPALSYLSVGSSKGWREFRQLFPQIISFSIDPDSLETLEDIEYNKNIWNSFRSLKNLEFHLASNTSLVIEALPQIPSPLSIIRFRHSDDSDAIPATWIWSDISDLIQEAETPSLLELRAICVSDGQVEYAEHDEDFMDAAGVLADMNISIQGFDEELDFKEVLEIVEKRLDDYYGY